MNDFARPEMATRQPFAAWLLLAAALLGWPPASRAQAPGEEVCSGCHEQGTVVAGSVHAGVSCAKCHHKHEEYPHPEGTPKPSCASCHEAQAGQHARSVHGRQLREGNPAAPDCSTCHGSAHEAARARTDAFLRHVPQTCGMCHSEIASEFETSVHGKALAEGVAGAPVCTDCHGEHSILSPKEGASQVHPLHIRETCGRCHGDLKLTRRFGLPADRLTSFDTSFHGLASKAGSQTVANCASCHGYHHILASTDPDSMTHPANLAETCGKCHPGAGKRFSLGPIHVGTDGSEPVLIRWVRGFYLFVIPTVVGLMLVHHGGDWLRKLRRLRFAPDGTPPARASAGNPGEDLRMYGWERLQHGLLAVSFVLLVWSGFALKYPNQWWAWPLVTWESYGPVRGTLHRIAGAVMIGVALMHVISLAASRLLRRHWLMLLPHRNDFREAVQGFAWRLGLRRQRPEISEHSYIEKIEYWAVIWGTLLMAVTGVMLWANNWMLAWLPKSVLDVAVAIHFYEAVLATLSILVWHFYSVIFDPDVYPMDPAWLTGRSPRARLTHAVEQPVPAEPPSGDETS